MKKINILFLETHYFDKRTGKSKTSGVDFARVVNPARLLMGHPDFNVAIRQDPILGSDEKSWDELTKKWDIIYSSYIDSVQGYVMMAIHAKKNKCAYITDVDDNLWEIPSDSPVFKTFHPGSQNLHDVSCALEDTPYVTTTNMFLKYKLVRYLKKTHDRIRVFPNYINLDYYNFQKIPPRTERDKITIAYYGTNTHGPDIMQPQVVNALKRICAEFKQVKFVTVGFFLPQIKAILKSQYDAINGEPDVYRWMELWGRLMGIADIVIAPLTDTDFNKCKSNIKYLEYSAAKRPGVYQDIRQYQEMVKMREGVPTGYLARNEEEWYKHLVSLVKDPALREKVGTAAYDFIKESHTMQANIDQYASYFKKINEENKSIGNLLNAGFIFATP